MADILAVLHFATKVDADDVEIVLENSAAIIADTNLMKEPQPLSSAEIKMLLAVQTTRAKTYDAKRTFQERTIHLWLLDFNACKPIEVNEVSIDRAVKAF